MLTCRRITALCLSLAVGLLLVLATRHPPVQSVVKGSVQRVGELIQGVRTPVRLPADSGWWHCVACMLTVAGCCKSMLYRKHWLLLILYGSISKRFSPSHGMFPTCSRFLQQVCVSVHPLIPTCFVKSSMCAGCLPFALMILTSALDGKSQPRCSLRQFPWSPALPSWLIVTGSNV